MAWYEMFDKLDDIIFEPIKLVTDWAREPLKSREHSRNIERDERRQRLDFELGKESKILDSKLSEQSRKLDADIEIRKKTEVQRILTEIETLKKDKDFQRMQAVSDAIIKYQRMLSELNLSAINSIGNMQLDLRKKAQDLVYEKTVNYKELQDSAHQQAFLEMQRIEDAFPGNEAAKSILYRSVDQRLANIIVTAQKFLEELNNDIAVLNQSINLLTEQGQSFIEGHLEKFHVITCGELPQGRSEAKLIINQEN
ncbi:MAG: hypothetical protein CML01_21460 [Pseudomonas sp.]|nr:hypothetical protein [Pseudomonas sp.]|tara:strand:- start:476 stop:1237 length:762 start_codon:yes stop_codon:yes gene_type:complete